jgi:hypothetical protein
MKLFAWQPTGHGPLSFFVMAEDEASARVAVEAFIQAQGLKGYDVGGWDTGDGYEFTIAEAGQVLINDNL